MDPLGNRMQQALALPSSVEAKTHGEGTEQQNRDHAGTVVVHPNKAALYHNKHGQHQQQVYSPYSPYTLDGLTMPNEQQQLHQQQQQQIHYQGQGYPTMQYFIQQPGSDMALPSGPGDNMPPGGAYPAPGYMMCAVHAGPQQQQLLSDDALRKRRQRLDKNKESVRNYRKKKREEEMRYKYYVQQLERSGQQHRANVERLESEKDQLELLVQTLQSEIKQLRSQLEEQSPPLC